MHDLFEGVVNLVVGGCLILFRKPLGQLMVKSQNKTWGFHFGNMEARLSEYVILVVGIAALGLGLLVLFG